MVDNVAITAGSGTTIAADDIGSGVLAQRVKLVWGPDGTGNDADVASGKPIPVQLRSSGGTDVSNALPVVTTNAGTFAVQESGSALTSLQLIDDVVFAEDAASANGDKGIQMLAKRSATPANTSGTDGDYEPLQVNGGLLWTNALSYAASPAFSITRPADTTAYASNDVWANSTSAPTAGGFTLSSAARKSGGSGILTDMLIMTSIAGVLQGEVHLFNQAATAVNDNAAWNLSDADALNRLAIIPFTLIADANNSYYHAQNLNIGFTCSGSADLRALIKVKAAYTPASGEVLTVTAKCVGID